MKIAVIGTGYVGLVTGTCLSDFGMHVTCVDKNAEKIRQLNEGGVTIYELGLKEIIARNTAKNRLFFTTDICKAVIQSSIIFIGVGTPENSDGTTNLSYIYEVIDQITDIIKEPKIIIIKSTVPVGTADKLRLMIRQKIQVPVDVISNPEFLREGSAIHDFFHPDRIVIGTDNVKLVEIVSEIYRPLILQHVPVICTDNKTAELIKYVANTILALKVSYINEISQICDLTGADIYDVAQAIGMDKRIGSQFLSPGPGFGGSCFPKDIKSLIHFTKNMGYYFKIGNAIININQQQMESVVVKCQKILKDVRNKIVTILGLSFKPNTDDINTCFIFICQKLHTMGAKIQAYDPAAMSESRTYFPQLIYCQSIKEACQNSDLIIITTEWSESAELNLDQLQAYVNKTNLYDTRKYIFKRIRK